MSDTALIIMARYPEPGKTKTRLARSIGNSHALALYQAFLTDLATRFLQAEWRLHWAYTPPDADYTSYISTLTTPPCAPSCFPQQGADFGERLRSVFQWAQTQAYQRTILIGSDSPHISTDIIASAQKALDEADVVLGPAEDGGYYLIAMKQPHDVFTGIPMSTAVVLHMTIKRAQQQGLTVRLLEPLFDIDEFSDLLRLAQLLERDSSLAPATAAYLITLRSLYDYNFDNNRYVAALDLH